MILREKKIEDPSSEKNVFLREAVVDYPRSFVVDPLSYTTMEY